MSAFVGDAVLNVGGGGQDMNMGPLSSRSFGGLDDLDVAPEVTGVVAEVTVPAAAGPGFDLHVHFRHFADGVRKGFEDDIGGGRR